MRQQLPARPAIRFARRYVHRVRTSSLVAQSYWMRPLAEKWENAMLFCVTVVSLGHGGHA